MLHAMSCLSICFEDGYYHDYLMMSDIPEQKYAGFYIYGVGMVDVEFSRDVYAALPEPEGECWCRKDDTMKPAMELMISEEPRISNGVWNRSFCSGI